MTSSSAALSLIALLLLLAASTPPPVHGQTTANPLSFLNTITGLLSGLTGPLLPPLNLNPIVAPILRSTLPVVLNVVGQLTCPGQGTGIGGVPVDLTCMITNDGLQVLTGRSITNANGAFAVNITTSPMGAIGLLLTLLPNNTIPCLVVSTPPQMVRSEAACPEPSPSSLLSIVQMVETDDFSREERVLNANAGASAAAV